jgi:2-keto-4-pentenoate hydratase
VRVGWKLGWGQREAIGGERAIGYLTSATRLDPGASYAAGDARRLNADVEVAVQLREDVAADADATTAGRAVGTYAAAIELVDLHGTDEPEAIVAANVWHRAFALGSPHKWMPSTGVEATLLVNGRPRARARSAADIGERVHSVVRLLGAIGERLEAGDWIITGSVVQVPVRSGDDVVAGLGPLGRARVLIG